MRSKANGQERIRTPPPGRKVSVWFFLVGLLSALGNTSALGQLTEQCVVSALNRTAFVEADGTWVLPNVPAGFGSVRVRATCSEPTGVRTGESGLLAVPVDGVVRVEELSFAGQAPVPAGIEIDAPVSLLTVPGQTVQLSVVASYPDGSNAEVAPAATGTGYVVSNPALATVDADGEVTALTSGTVLVTALHEGAVDVIAMQVLLSGDSDGDGLPDDFEVANGLDPNDPADAFEDPDGDGLSTADEFPLGLDPFDPDTDGDTLLDGEEINTFGTDPLRFDTDSDGLSDGLEVATGSDPLDPADFNLAAALESIAVDPAAVTLVVDAVFGEASRQLVVTGLLIDGTELDLTGGPYGTIYRSSDLSVVNFGAEPGRLFAGQDGTATVEVDAGGHLATVAVQVESFAPQALAAVGLPGFANAIALDRQFAFVAAGAGGLVTVDVTDPAAPIPPTGSLSLPGNANDLAVADGFAYVAAGPAGLQVVDVADPGFSTRIGSLATPGIATDLAVAGDIVYLVDELGLRVIDVTDPAAPLLLDELETPGRARGVDVEGPLVAIADEDAGVHLVDVTDPAAPFLLGSTPTRPDGISRAADVTLRGSLAYVADGREAVLGGLRVLDVSEPTNPVVVGTTSDAFGLTSVEPDGRFALAADYLFVNAVPIFDVAAAEAPLFRSVLDFSAFGDAEGHGIAVRNGLVYLVGAGCCGTIRDNGTWSSKSALFIGRYRSEGQEGQRSPAVVVTAPADGSAVIERRRIELAADATDDLRVESVEFFVDGVSGGIDYAAPFTVEVTVPEGATELSIGAVAIDGNGLTASAESVRIGVAADDSPTVRLLAPRPGATYSEGVRIPVAAVASDDIGLPTVEVRIDGAPVAQLAAPPYRVEITVPSGVASFEVTAIATDGAGQTASTGPVVVNVIPDEPPTVALLEPVDGLQVPAGGAVRMVAAVADDFGIPAVTFTIDGAAAATDPAPPYELGFRVPDTPAPLTVGAVAVDAIGQPSLPDEVVLEMIADPGTTAIGHVVDATGAPVAGASLQCRDVAGSSAADGSFAVSGVPTADGLVYCLARTGPPDERLGVSAGVTPVLGGVTDVGEIVVRGQRLLAVTRGDFAGALLEVEPETPGGVTTTTLGQPSDEVLSGLAQAADGRLYAATFLELDGFSESRLLEIDPATGELVADFGLLRTAEGDLLAVDDLAAPPAGDGPYALSDDVLYRLAEIGAPAERVGGLDVGFGAEAEAIDFAPDGRLIVLGVAGFEVGEVWIFDPVTLEALDVVSTRDILFGPMAVEPSGTSVLIGSFEDLWRFDLVSGTRELLGELDRELGDLEFGPRL